MNVCILFLVKPNLCKIKENRCYKESSLHIKQMPFLTFLRPGINAIPNFFFSPGIEETLKFSLEHSTVSTPPLISVTRAVGRCVWDGRDENCGTAKLSRE